MEKNLILASESPYKKELLERLQVAFTCRPGNIDEDEVKLSINNPVELTKKLAFFKAQKIFRQNPRAIVIGSDQVSVLDDTILGKPGDKESAIKQLLFLSGKTHQLITSVCILVEQDIIEWQDHTSLSMRNLTHKQAEDYVKKDNPLNCAGSYKIESLGISLFESIETQDFTAITGLPLISLANHLRKLNILE